MSTLYKPKSKLAKLARILAELDREQAELDRHDREAAEDLRWARIFVSKTAATIATNNS